MQVEGFFIAVLSLSYLIVVSFLSFCWFLRVFFERPAIKQLEDSKRSRRNYEEMDKKRQPMCIISTCQNHSIPIFECIKSNQTYVERSNRKSTCINYRIRACRLYGCYLCSQSQYETGFVSGYSAGRTIDHHNRSGELSGLSRWDPGA